MKSLFARLAALFRRPSASAAAEGPAPSPRAPSPPFEPANDIERLLMQAAIEPALRSRFVEALLDSDLYVATPERPESGGWRTLEAETKVAFLTLAGPDGRPTPAVFTSQQRIVDAFGAGTGYLQMEAATLFEMIWRDGVLLNPGSAYGVHWTSEQMAAVLGKPASWTVEKDTQIMLGAPAERPEALIAALRRALSNDPRIEEAWLALAHWPESGEWAWHLDLRSEAPGEELSGLLGDAFAKAALGERALNMIVHPPGGAPGAGIRVLPAETH